MNDTVIKIDNVSMKFNLMTEKINSFKEYIIQRLKGNVFFEEFWALEDISLEIKQGDIYGVMGLNGAGKSTLLKVISGILKPTKGKVEVCGNIAPLIELGAGFDPDLTARENIFLNGAILGYTRGQMEEQFEQIVSFSGLEEFLDVPLKNFSSGMYARLGFSIATAVEPDILIIDEILSVGDITFQNKCKKRIGELINGTTTVIFVSHSVEQVNDLCNKGIILEEGKLTSKGDIDKVCQLYYSKYE